MNLELTKVRVKRRCEVIVKEHALSWRETRQCHNMASIEVEGKAMCIRHAQVTVFNRYLLFNPPI